MVRSLSWPGLIYAFNPADGHLIASGGKKDKIV